ncbi:MAG: PilZ domain-containing protein [Candidatus Omnitrophota bacterium]|nr:PilZ domain-containing protein [Candidatus Omnitrophota bacterium]
MPENVQIELDILLGETEAEELKLRGKIARLNRKEDGLYEYGISFVDMGKEARRLFADYCFAKMYEMIGLSEWPTDKRVKKD